MNLKVTDLESESANEEVEEVEESDDVVMTKPI
jgi:hypothetical protein